MGKKICVNCNKHSYDKEHAKGEKLCKSCLKRLSRESCPHCSKDFHILDKNKDKPSPQPCTRCEEDIELYGLPRECECCKLPAAFEHAKCRRCMKSVQQHGDPIQCQSCHQIRAFNKAANALEKVDGQTLCYVCTLQYKRTKRGKDKEEKDSDRKNKPAKRKREDSSASPSTSMTDSAVSSLLDSNSSSRQSEDSKDTDWQAKFLAVQKQADETERERQNYLDKLVACRKELGDIKQELQGVKQQNQEYAKRLAMSDGRAETIETAIAGERNRLNELHKVQRASLYQKIETLQSKLSKYESVSSQNKDSAAESTAKPVEDE